MTPFEDPEKIEDYQAVDEQLYKKVSAYEKFVELINELTMKLKGNSGFD